MSPETVLQEALKIKTIMDNIILESLPPRLYVCRYCGALNSYFKYHCEGCEDPNGGDSADD